MIYQDVKRYLKKQYGEPNINFMWSYLDTIKFFEYIERRYSMQEFKKEISEVKEAFRDFFEGVGNIVFRYTDSEEIKLKIFPYRVKPQNSKHLKKLVKIIRSNRKAIKYNYNGKEHQIAILGKIRREINIEIFDSDESVNKKELIKYAIRLALELDEQDIVVKLKRKFIVKLYQKHKEQCQESTEQEQEKCLINRYNGYSKEDVEKIYNTLFGKEEFPQKVKTFLQKVMQKLFETELNFRYIDNKYYEAHVLKLVHNTLAQELIDYIDLEKDFLLGVTGYIMRKHFYYIHELMAIELIECIYEKNNNANQFLLFYNGKVIVKDGKKYQIPSLETEDGKQWNNSSLIGICNLWMNIKRKRENVEQKLRETELRIKELKESLSYIEPEKRVQEEIIEKHQVLLAQKLKLFNEIRSKLQYLENTSLNSDEYFNIYEKFKIMQQEVLELEKIIREAKEKIEVIKNTNISQYTELEVLVNHKKQLLLDGKAQDLNIDSKNSQMKPIIKSIVHVLMSRQKVIEN